MFDELLLHGNTKKQLDSFMLRPANGLLIGGPAGSGKKHLSYHLAANLLGVPVAKLINHPHFIVINREEAKSEISIDSSRSLIKKLSLRVPGEVRAINRVAVIHDADLLSTEAQNGLLKLLEEPPAGTLIILTTSSPDKLLPTVVSRLQKISVSPVESSAAVEFFESNFLKSDIVSAWQLSRGAAGLMNALLSEGSNHHLKLAVEDAKQLLRLPPYDRLIYLQKLSKDKSELASRLDALSRVLAVLDRANITGGKTAAAARLLQARRLVSRLQSSLEHNANAKLAALELALNMPL